MRPLFTIHAGEFVVGEYIERHFRSLNVWIPSKDTGIDLLVTNKENSCTISLQVKLSRDYRAPEAITDFERRTIAAGWLNFRRDKIQESTANFWVIVLVSCERRLPPQFIIIPPGKLLEHLTKVDGNELERHHFYPWVTNDNRALNGRGINPTERGKLAEHGSIPEKRDLTAYLNNWGALKSLASTS